MRDSVASAALVALALCLALAAGCSPADSATTTPKPVSAAVDYPVTVTDDAGRSVTVAAEPQRIVSLAPANTEILFALGVTSYDDYPAEVVDIEKVGDFAGPNIEAVAAANPDVVFVTTGVQGDIVTKLEELGATVIAIDPQTLNSVYENIEEVALVVNRVEEGERVVAEMQATVDEIVTSLEGVERATCFVEIAQNPLFTAGKGTLIDELITLAGGTNVVESEGWVPYSVEEVIKADPAVYLATLGSMSDPAELEKRPGFKDLSAVKGGRVHVLEDNLVSRPGPRIVEGLRVIASALHPQAFGQ
jgi:iron complex transport system substrate-binding protein